MANTNNTCSDLNIEDMYKQRGYDKYDNPLSDLYNLQDNTQKMYFTKQNKKQFYEFTIGDVVDFLMINNHALIDEIHEMTDALGGINDGVGNAAWKPWKSKNKEIRNKRLNDLSENDLKELKMEWIDMLHFVFNAGLCIGITPDEIYNYYLSKNKENWNRQNKNY